MFRCRQENICEFLACCKSLFSCALAPGFAKRYMCLFTTVYHHPPNALQIFALISCHNMHKCPVISRMAITLLSFSSSYMAAPGLSKVAEANDDSCKSRTCEPANPSIKSSHIKTHPAGQRVQEEGRNGKSSCQESRLVGCLIVMVLVKCDSP